MYHCTFSNKALALPCNLLPSITFRIQISQWTGPFPFYHTSLSVVVEKHFRYLIMSVGKHSVIGVLYILENTADPGNHIHELHKY
jgi:hypothetical protein